MAGKTAGMNAGSALSLLFFLNCQINAPVSGVLYQTGTHQPRAGKVFL